MKELKISVILLAFLLAAMVLVPMVSATINVNYSLVSDVSTLPFPQLHFNTSQQYAKVTTELDPDPNTQVADVTNLLATSQNPNISNIPYGSIIYHSKNGITTVFDANGNQLFAAKDANSPIIPTPSGSMPATHIFGFPSGSAITTWGNITYVSDSNVLLYKMIVEGSPTGSTTSSPIPGLVDPHQYVEGINATPTSSSLGDFSTYWTVPSNPQLSEETPIVGMIYLWNGISTIGNNPIIGTSELIQPVLQWNVQTLPNQWSLASWMAWGNEFAGHTTNVTDVTTGDVIVGQMTYNPPTKTWTILARDTSKPGMPTATYTVEGSMPNSNVVTEVYLESYNTDDSTTYMPGPTPFYTFTMLDTNSKNCCPASIMEDYQRSNFPGLTLNIANTQDWPNSISYPLIFST
jgi:hypothetical protein